MDPPHPHTPLLFQLLRPQLLAFPSRGLKNPLHLPLLLGTSYSIKVYASCFRHTSFPSLCFDASFSLLNRGEVFRYDTLVRPGPRVQRHSLSSPFRVSAQDSDEKDFRHASPLFLLSSKGQSAVPEPPYTPLSTPINHSAVPLEESLTPPKSCFALHLGLGLSSIPHYHEYLSLHFLY